MKTISLINFSHDNSKSGARYGNSVPAVIIFFLFILFFMPGCGAKVNEKEMNQAYKQAYEKNTAEEWRNFLKKYPKHKEKAKIEYAITKLEEAGKELETIKKKNDWNSWKEFIAKHPDQRRSDENWNQLIEAGSREFETSRYISLGNGIYRKKQENSISLNFSNLKVFKTIASRAGGIDTNSIHKFGIALSIASQDELDPYQAVVYLSQIDELFDGNKFKSKELNGVLSRIGKASVAEPTTAKETSAKPETTGKAEVSKSKTSPAQKILQLVFGRKFETAQQLMYN
ncbi:MAG: hypothetical protein LWY06_09630 [Firmicutes bacterium]|nr:hypothetical protein [Bacillota bacterium]